MADPLITRRRESEALDRIENSLLAACRRLQVEPQPATIFARDPHLRTVCRLETIADNLDELSVAIKRRPKVTPIEDPK